MSSTDQNTPGGKSGRRSRKAPRNPKSKQTQSPQADRAEPAEQPIVSTSEPAETAPIEAAAEPADTAAIEAAAAQESAPIEAAAPVETGPVDVDTTGDAPPPETRAVEDTVPVGAGAAPAPAPVSLQTIANAYGDYTRRSLEETRSFVEKLKGAKSLDKAVEVQTEFAHHAFEIFVAEFAEDLRAPQGARPADAETAGEPDKQAEPRPALDRKASLSFPVQMGERKGSGRSGAFFIEPRGREGGAIGAAVFRGLRKCDPPTGPACTRHIYLQFLDLYGLRYNHWIIGRRRLIRRSCHSHHFSLSSVDLGIRTQARSSAVLLDRGEHIRAKKNCPLP